MFDLFKGSKPSKSRKTLAYSVSHLERLSNVVAHLPQFLHKKADVKSVQKKELKLDILASVLIGTFIFAAMLQKLLS